MFVRLQLQCNSCYSKRISRDLKILPHGGGIFGYLIIEVLLSHNTTYYSFIHRSIVSSTSWDKTTRRNRKKRKKEAEMQLKTVQKLELPAAADMHVHLRQGEMMEVVVPTLERGGVDTAFVYVFLFDLDTSHWFLMADIGLYIVCRIWYVNTASMC